MYEFHEDLGEGAFGQVKRATFKPTGEIMAVKMLKEDLEVFKRYISEIDVDYWETKYDAMPIKRKIVVSTIQNNLSLLFDRSEFDAFKNLLYLKTKTVKDNLTVLDIDYTLFLN